MTQSGWIIMLLSVGSVTVLFVWCLYRVLSYRPPPEKLHGFDIDTQDTENDS
jgi:hypothetical protein